MPRVLHFHPFSFSFLVFIFTLSTQDGDSALTLAAWHGRTDVVVELVKAGANLNLQNKVHTLSILCTSYIFFKIINVIFTMLFYTIPICLLFKIRRIFYLLVIIMLIL